MISILQEIEKFLDENSGMKQISEGLCRERQKLIREQGVIDQVSDLQIMLGACESVTGTDEEQSSRVKQKIK